MNTPIDLYHGALESLDLQADSQGAIHQKDIDGNLIPEKIDGRQLVLPTPDVLRVISTDTTMIPFHPLSENITMGESVIIRRMKLWAANKLTLMMVVLGTSLLEIASEKGPLTAETTELGKALANATPKTLKHFLNVVNSIDQVNKQLVTIYIKRKGKLPDREQPYRRVAVVRFPIMDEFHEGKPDNMIFDVNVSKKDKIVIGDLFRFMLKNIEVENAYTVGTDSSSAPNFVALMRAFAGVATELASHALAMKSKINDPILLPKLGWLSMLDDLTVFTGVIPPLRDNEGESETMNANLAIQAANPAPVTPAPSVATTNGVPMYQQPTVGRYATTNTVQQQQVQPQMMQPQAMYPQQPMMQPMYGQPMYGQQPQQPDFGALVSQQAVMNNPMMQQPMMQPMMMPPQPMFGQPMVGMMPPMAMPMMPGAIMPGQLPNGVPMQPQAMYQQPQGVMPMSFAPGQGAGKYQTA